MLLSIFYRKIKNIDDDRFISQILYNHKHCIMNRYLGDIIVDIYKKDNPTQQSIWSLD